jgi:hypothetical protein
VEDLEDLYKPCLGLVGIEGKLCYIWVCIFKIIGSWFYVFIRGILISSASHLNIGWEHGIFYGSFIYVEKSQDM